MNIKCIPAFAVLFSMVGLIWQQPQQPVSGHTETRKPVDKSTLSPPVQRDVKPRTYAPSVAPAPRNGQLFDRNGNPDPQAWERFYQER